MKYWVISANDKLEPELKRKLRRLLKPILSVGRPGKCEFCGMMTTWIINKRLVCPACHVKYGFLPQWKLPDKCEVCDGQGEWCPQGDPQHSLCYIHRDKWHHWEIPELKFIDSRKQPEKWNQAWEAGWAKFVSFMKAGE